MSSYDPDDLVAAKNRVWFYRFDLPDGTTTYSDFPEEILHIHTSRRDALIKIIETCVPNAASLTALDFASNEGYYSIELARHFRSVLGLEYRPRNIAAANLIAKLQGVRNVAFAEADLQKMEYSAELCADFVLVYGLIYHLEDPIHTLRLASQLSRKHIMVETQIFPFEISGKIEDGHYKFHREVHGVFSLSVDDSRRRGGGSTDLALVPSLNALLFLLRTFGFTETSVIAPKPTDYEQFRRGSRVIVYGAKAS